MSNRPQYKRYVHVMYMYIQDVPQIFSRRQKFSWRFPCNDDDDDGWGVETGWTTCQFVGRALEVVQHICMCMYMYLYVLCVCVCV